jgi:hypothetical protein
MTSVGGGNVRTPGAGLLDMPYLNLEQLAKFDSKMQMEIVNVYKMALQAQMAPSQTRAPPSVMKSASTPGISHDLTAQNVWYSAWVSKNRVLKVCVCAMP